MTFTGLKDEDGSPLILADVDTFKLKIAESEPTGTVVVSLDDSSDAARFTETQSRAEVSVQILDTDYSFVANKEYYFQLFAIRGGITNTTPPRRFQVIAGISPN